MKSHVYIKILFFGVLLTILCACKREGATPDYNGYPSEVGEIVITKCATPGCHTFSSKEAASGLSLESWYDAFDGNRNGAVIIPYRPDYSTFCYYINTYSDLGLTLTPTMPVGADPLTKEEVVLLRDWILQGAPDIDGNVKFADNASRKKIYVVNQGCDVVTVFDAETSLPMRYVDVGISAAVESPHMVRVSPDGQYWYVVFLASSVIQKFRASDDSHVADISIGSGYWNTLTISSDSKYAFCVDWSANGKIAYVDLQTNSLLNTWTGLFSYPHGSAINKTNDTLFVTAQTGNFIYRIPVNDPISAEMVSLNPFAAASTNPAISYDPHEIIFTPDGTKCFITCQKSNEVRVLKTATNQVLTSINTGIYPQEMAISTSTDYLFVTCTEDTAVAGKRGSVTIINYKTNAFVKKIYLGFQPHGIVVDDANNLVYVANRNANSKGPAPHHSNTCGGRNGFITFIDLNTLEEIVGKKIEVSVDPYSAAIRN
ncbi:MAG: beta-propeller fold lactonase family protein [Bacteroidetes bacterium]|nr:beta-propeller fold lactonase family protein [Bacteroidota bacterium]